MRLGTRMRYGSRAMVYLAMCGADAPVSVSDIAMDQGLSTKYLEQVLATLRSAGLVHSVRGAQGGYALARQPDEISLWDVYEAIEGKGGLVDCTVCPERCPRSRTCVTREVWSDLHGVFRDYLARHSLETLAARARDVGSLQAAITGA